MKRENVIYISGKYSGKDHDEIAANIKKVREAAIKLWELGYTALAPHLNTYHFEDDCKCGYQDYIDGDLVLLRRCDAVLLLDGWEDSKGACIEKKEAEEYGVAFFFDITLLDIYFTKLMEMP